jgi:protein SCO1
MPPGGPRAKDNLGRVSSRLSLALFATACALFAVIGVIAISRISDDNSSGAAAVVHGPKSPFRGATMPPGVRAPDFKLIDQNGKPVTMGEYRGRPVVVTYLYTTCEETCPIAAQIIRGAMDDLGHDVPALAISVDPFRDTPASARAFLRKANMKGRLRWVLGKRRQLRPVWKGFAIQPQLRDVEHQALITLVDRNGFQRIGNGINQTTPEDLAHDIKLLESGKV